MEFEKRIDNKAGNYLVTGDKSFEDMLNKYPLTLNGLTVNVGDETTLYNWFDSPVLFCGFLEDGEAVFYLGQGESSLFESGAYYYDLTYIIAQNRIGKSYSSGTFRDSFLREKNNIKYWK